MAPRPSRKRARSALLFLLGVAGLFFAVIAVCEWQGWPFLAKPAERWLGARLQRTVSFEDSRQTSLRLHLLGGVSLHAGRIQIGNPGWSDMGPMMVATDAMLELRWRDLLTWRAGGQLHIDQLTADTLGLAVQRLPDGRASWQFGGKDSSGPPMFDGLRWGHVAVRAGTASVNDAIKRLEAKATFSVLEPTDNAQPTTAAGALIAQADGSLDKLPLHATLRAGAALNALSTGAGAAALPVELRATVGRARLAFDGSVTNLLNGLDLKGHYDLSGPSLAAVGQPLRVTLPTTHPFAMQGSLAHAGTRWTTVVESATIGRSKLAGEFTFDAAPGTLPKLSGRLTGPVLWLQDLGPVVGLAVDSALAPARPGRVLPAREFDLPSLRAMDADIQIALARLESGSARLQAVAPLTAHLLLAGGVLDIDDLDARLAQGHIRGRIQLDGRERIARWQTQLNVSGLVLEQWILQPRAGGAAPYATGRLGARVDLHGRGRSSAELLASADGRATLHWTRGTISHLAVELAGIDVAQSLGLLVRGDDALPVTCGVADLVIKSGQVTPQLMLVDTRDSAIWIDGTLSLASEQMHLVARVAPKDFSPLALRTPLHIDGPLASPQVTLEKAPLLRRLVPAALLALINPLAALLPLIDPGDDEARNAISACQAMAAARRGKS